MGIRTWNFWNGAWLRLSTRTHRVQEIRGGNLQSHHVLGLVQSIGLHCFSTLVAKPCLANRKVSSGKLIPATGGCTIGVGILPFLDRFDYAPDDVFQSQTSTVFQKSLQNIFEFPISHLPVAASPLPTPAGPFFWPPLLELLSQVYALIMIMVKGESWRMQAIVWKYLVVSFSNMCRGS